MGTIIGIIATLFLLAGIYGIWRQKGPFTTWKPVPALVIDQSLQRERHLFDDKSLHNIVGADTIDTLRKLQQRLEGDTVQDAGLIQTNVRTIVYQYQVDGTAYTSSMVYLDHEGSSDDLFDRFPVGRKVTAYVHPTRPGRSYLIPTPKFLGYGMVLVCLWVLSLLVAIDWVTIDGGMQSQVPANWLPYMACWWGAGVVAVIHYASLRGPFTAGAAICSLLYFVLASLPYLIPWTNAHAIPWVSAHLGPLLAEYLPATTGIYVLLALFGGGLIGLVVVLPLWAVASVAWESHQFHTAFVPVQATVIVSELRKARRGGSSGKSSPYMYYWPEIQFEYTVDDKTYDSGVYAPTNTVAGARHEPTVKMHEVLAAYPVGSVHTARYNAEQPHIAYLTADEASWGGLKSTGKYLAILLLVALAMLLVVALIAINR